MQDIIDPQDVDETFWNMWCAGGAHLEDMFKSTDAKWLRAELPLFREHYSFSLGDNLFFVQVYDAEDTAGHLRHSNRLEMIVEDAHAPSAKALGCFLPMKKSSNGWKPAMPGWGLFDYKTSEPINPSELKREILESSHVQSSWVEMGDWEIHDAGVMIARNYLTANGWEIEHWQSNRHVFPSLIALKEEQRFAFVVTTSVQPHSEKGHRPESAALIRSKMRQLGLIPKFIGLAVADGTHDPFDPRLIHLKRRLFRGGKILSSTIEIEDL
jgi:hypothetical protein